MKNKKQTAVEYLIDELSKVMIENQIQQVNYAFEQAKAMEKEQITNAYYDGSQDAPIKVGQSEQYYLETYE